MTHGCNLGEDCPSCGKNVAGHARTTDPSTSHQRTYPSRAAKLWAELLREEIKVREKGSTRLYFTDDDCAELLGVERNVAAKVRQTLEREGKVIRTGIYRINKRRQKVLSFRTNQR